MSAMASFKLLVGVLVAMTASGAMVTASPAAPTKDTIEFCSFVAGDGKNSTPAVSTCLKKLGIKAEKTVQLLKSDDDKCLSKCILNEFKEIKENGEPDMAMIETGIKAHVPSQYQKQALSDTKSCLQSSADILKQSGSDKNVAVCKFAASLMKCYMKSHEKMCEGIRG